MKKRSKEFFGTFLVILTAIFSGFNIVANKFFVETIDPLVFTAMRALLIGTIFFFISFFIAKNKKQKFKKTSWKKLFLIGIIGGSIAFWLFFTGLKITTAGKAAFLHKTLPLYAAIFAFFFLKEKISKKLLISLAVMLCGLIFMSFSKISFGLNLGDLLVIAATVLWALEYTISKKLMLKKESNWVITFSRMFFGSLILIAIIILTGKTSEIINLNSSQIIYILVSGFLLLLYVLTFYWGLKHINLTKASTILLLAPVISLILGIALLGETASLMQLIGSALILIGAFFVIKSKSEKRKINPLLSQ